MDEKNKEIPQLIKKTFLEAVDILSKNYQGSSLTDIFITVDKESGEVAIYDDEENRAAEVVIFDWIDKVDELPDEYIASVLRAVTEDLDGQDAFASLELYKPFSINYADENFVVIEELLLITDDSTVQLDNDLLEKFDREFDDFLEKLLKE
ncbi:hypothetical protein [Dysgonomonas sp. ZJ709]|uniref:hypothetical protein n=1 Tax=Dysgonomonas sp. ZJ709 TaxID=2709797 RepID=UPI0013ED574E|nr:hypothetical protein [Dysgonomonas sp. ZJ709]